MRARAPWLMALSLLLVLSGCAGRDFVRPSTDTFVLGKTTYAEIVARYGSPFREGTTLKNDKTIKSISYAYSTAGGSAVVSGVTPARALGFYFIDLVLIGHEFISSFREDATEFDETKVTAIRKGESTQAHVLDLLGPPTGRYAYPLITNPGDVGLVYLYGHTRIEHIPFAPKVHHYRKSIVVSIGANGVVTEVTFSASGEK